MKPGMHIIEPEPISTAYFINPSHKSVCLHMYPTIVARQRLRKNVTAATIEEFLDFSFSMRSRVESNASRRLVLPRTSYLNSTFEN
jgi:hypothetical protein